MVKIGAPTPCTRDEFIRFMNSILELKKIFMMYPSMMLFLQEVDHRDSNEKITKGFLEKMYNDLDSKMPNRNIVFMLTNRIISLDSNCNAIFNRVNRIIWFWSVASSTTIQLNTGAGGNTNNLILHVVKQFYDNFIYLFIYAGCINFAQFFCDNYVELILIPDDATDPHHTGLTLDNWKQRFMTTFDKYEEVKQFKNFLQEKAESSDLKLNIIICSNPDTRTGIAYLGDALNKNLVSLTANHQSALQHNIYKSDGNFFNSNEIFYNTLLASDTVNTIDQIKFCSFYKFQRFQDDGNPFRTNFGSMMNETVYVSINVGLYEGDNVNIESGQVFSFLKIIINYFKGLQVGAPVVDIGMSGPIKRIIFGGNFGCNLLHDAEICAQFAKNGIKIYTRPANSNGLFDNDKNPVNQMFIVDANLENAPSSALRVGGGGGIDEIIRGNKVKQEEPSQNKRITIGEPIEQIQSSEKENVKLLIVNNNKKKTRRRYKKMINK